MYKICFVEDEEHLASIVSAYLEKAGYEVIHFTSGQEAISYIGNPVHLWILDIMLKDDINGYDIIKAIRKQDETVPVIFTSARDQDLDRILGLELGSDDYITKPYSSKELVLRVEKMLKRCFPEPDKNKTYTYKNYQIDINQRIVMNEGKEIVLTTLEFDLLLLFLKNLNKSFSREEILEQIWGQDYFGSDRVVDDLIRRLRKKMPQLRLSTIYGYGYRLS